MHRYSPSQTTMNSSKVYFAKSCRTKTIKNNWTQLPRYENIKQRIYNREERPFINVSLFIPKMVTSDNNNKRQLSSFENLKQRIYDDT